MLHCSQWPRLPGNRVRDHLRLQVPAVGCPDPPPTQLHPLPVPRRPRQPQLLPQPRHLPATLVLHHQPGHHPRVLRCRKATRIVHGNSIATLTRFYACRIQNALPCYAAMPVMHINMWLLLTDLCMAPIWHVQLCIYVIYDAFNTLSIKRNLSLLQSDIH